MARTDDVWVDEEGLDYIKPLRPSGYNILISGYNRYLNFNSVSGSSGYGFRDNSGVLEYKNSGDAWKTFSAGGGTWGSITGTLSDQTDLQNALDGKLDKAIEITTEDFFDLITSGDLIPSQYYLLTDYQNETPISNSNPVEYVIGGIEQIYLFATSTNTFHPEGISKTYPDERVVIKQNVDGILSDLSGSDYSSGTYKSFAWESQASVGEIGITIDDTDQFSLTGLTTAEKAYIDGFKNALYNDFYDNTVDIAAEMTGDNRNNDWSISDGVVTILDGDNEWISNGLDLVNFIDNDKSYMYGQLVTGSEWISSSEEIIWTVIDSTHLQLSGTQSDRFATRAAGGSIYIYDNQNYIELYLTDENFNDTWTYDAETKILTYTGGEIDFEDLSAPDSSISCYFQYFSKFFPYGRIIARRNLKLNTYIEADYRSQLFRRYKLVATTWAGTGTKGTTYRITDGFDKIYVCINNTTTTPSSSAADFIYIGADDYVFSVDMVWQHSAPVTTLTIDSTSYTDLPMFDVDSAIGFDSLTDPINLTLLTGVSDTTANIVFLSDMRYVKNSKVICKSATVRGGWFYNNDFILNNVVFEGLGNITENKAKITSSVLRSTFINNDINNMTGCFVEIASKNKIFEMSYCISKGGFWENEGTILYYVLFAGYTTNNKFISLKHSDFMYAGTESNPTCARNYFLNTGNTSADRARWNTFDGMVTDNFIYSLNFYANSFHTLTSNTFYYTVSYNYYYTASTCALANNVFFGFVQYNCGDFSVTYNQFRGNVQYNVFYPFVSWNGGVSKNAGGTGYTLNDILTLTSGVTTTAWASYTSYIKGQYVTNGGDIYLCTITESSSSSFSQDLSLGKWMLQKPVQVKVTGVSGGAVTLISLKEGGSCFPTGTFNTTGGTGSGCTITIANYAARSSINYNSFATNFTSNYFFATSVATNVFYGVVTGNSLQAGYYTTSIQSNILNAFSYNVMTGTTFGNNVIGQRCSNSTFNDNSNFSYNNVLTYVYNFILSSGYAVATSSIQGLGGNTGLGLTLSANISGCYIPDILGGGITISTNITDKFYAKGIPILLGGQVAKTISMERHLTANTAGNTLTITSGGATSGATDKNGGDNIIESGTATGTGSSNIIFKTATAGATGTTDRVVSEKVRIMGDGTVAIGVTSPNANAIMDIVSTTKAFMPPRMTNAQMGAIGTPTAGMVVYDSTNNKLCCYDGATWQNCW